MSDFREYLNVYKFDCTLPGSGEKVEFKPITTGQLKTLLTYEGEDDPMVIEEALDKLMSSAIVSEGFDITDLYLQDRFYLLVEIRKRTKGSKYKFTQICRHCNSETLQSIDINKMKVNKPTKVDNWVKMNDDISVKLSYIKRIHNIEAHEVLKSLSNYNEMSETQRETEMTILTHAATIESVKTPKGKEAPDLLERQYLLENVRTGAYEDVKKWHEKNDFGLEFKFTYKCLHCKKKETASVPTEGFFV